jgi:SAM-dependent methyltransferase
MTRQKHWDSIYATQEPDRVSWYRPHLERSLEFLAAAHLPQDASIIDVGGGSSTLVDDLLDLGFCNVTVLDVSQAALDAAQRRLGQRAATVTWMQGDVTRAELPPRRFDFWHDRAVFHFLTDGGERERYVDLLRRSLAANGHVFVATFGPAGPDQCSGLPVVRHSDDTLYAEFGPPFQQTGSTAEVHCTPWGTSQEFVYCCCRVPS